MPAFMLWSVVSFICLLPGIHCEISGFPVYEEVVLCRKAWETRRAVVSQLEKMNSQLVVNV